MREALNSLACLFCVGLALACGAKVEPGLSLSNDRTGSDETVELSDAELEQARFALIEGTVGREMAARVLTRLGNEGKAAAYELVLSDEQRVSWYESRPGVVTTVERGLVGNEPLTAGLGELSLEDQYSILAGAPAPRELREMQARRDEMRPAYEQLAGMKPEVPEWLWARRPKAADEAHREEPTLERPESSMGVLRAPLARGGINPVTSAECVKLCDDGDFVIRMLEKKVDTTIARSDASSAFVRGCGIYRGPVTYRADKRVWWDWSIEFNLTLAEGEYAASWLRDTWDFDFETYLRNFGPNAKAAMCAEGHE